MRYVMGSLSQLERRKEARYLRVSRKAGLIDVLRLTEVIVIVSYRDESSASPILLPCLGVATRPPVLLPYLGQ